MIESTKELLKSISNEIKSKYGFLPYVVYKETEDSYSPQQPDEDGDSSATEIEYRAQGYYIDVIPDGFTFSNADSDKNDYYHKTETMSGVSVVITMVKMAANK